MSTVSSVLSSSGESAKMLQMDNIPTELLRTADKQMEECVKVIGAKADGRGAAMRWLRERAGWTMREMAEKIGYSAASINEWESEHKWPQPMNLRKILAILGVDPRIIVRFLGGSLEESAALTLDVSQEAVKMSEFLDATEHLTDYGFEEAFHDYYYRKVVSVVALKALSGDVRAQTLYLQRADKFALEKSLHSLGKAGNSVPLGSVATVCSYVGEQKKSPTDLGP